MIGWRSSIARAPLTADEVIALVAGHVAHYKRIRQVAFVDQIPKSPSGEFLRRVLVAREREGDYSPLVQ